MNQNIHFAHFTYLLYKKRINDFGSNYVSWICMSPQTNSQSIFSRTSPDFIPPILHNYNNLVFGGVVIVTYVIIDLPCILSPKGATYFIRTVTVTIWTIIESKMCIQYTQMFQIRQTSDPVAGIAVSVLVCR